MKWGTVGERGKRMGKEGGGGRSVYKQPGTKVDRDRTTRKGGIPSKRDLGTGEGFSGQRGNHQGDCQGVIKGIVPCALNNVNPVHIVLLCVCRANKRIVSRL